MYLLNKEGICVVSSSEEVKYALVGCFIMTCNIYTCYYLVLSHIELMYNQKSIISWALLWNVEYVYSWMTNNLILSHAAWLSVRTTKIVRFWLGVANMPFVTYYISVLFLFTFCFTVVAILWCVTYIFMYSCIIQDRIFQNQLVILVTVSVLACL